jgi:predicted metal-binding membrane protein
MAARQAAPPFAPLFWALVGVAWLALWLWEQSPYGRYLDHGSWTEAGLAGAICGALPAGGILVPGALYVGGFLLMVAAMMLPTSLPLLRRFALMVGDRADGRALLALLIGGYLLVWTGFGLVAHVLDWAVHDLLHRMGGLARHGWVVGAVVLAVAGAFQFSRLKYRCLSACRTPMSFIAQHWTGRAAGRAALRLGLHHGLFCVGCCWAIMLLMFVVGTGNVGWMLLLGAVMAVEKNSRWGRLLSAPLGVALLAAAALVVTMNLPL